MVNLVKFASCNCVHSFVHGCLKVGNGNIKFGMGMCRFGMEPFSRRGSAAWLLVAVRALVLVSELRAAAIQVVSVGFHGRNTCPACESTLESAVAPRRKFSLASGAVDISTG